MAEQLVRTVFDWEHFLVYLAGPIDQAHDGGRGWREEWTEKLLALGLKKHQVLSPTKKPLSGTLFNLDDEAEIMRELRGKRDWDGLEDKVSQVAHIDLRLVDKSDLVIAHFPRVHRGEYDATFNSFNQLIRDLVDECQIRRDGYIMSIVAGMTDLFSQVVEKAAEWQIPTYGTMHEVIVARQQKKPVMVVWEGGREKCSGWLMWLVGHEHVFGSFEEMLDYLSKASQGQAAIDVRDWLLLDLNKHK
jgi:hypothetical protein